ncbi:MAG: hypothetical protein WC290_03115 [archaeon]|jgi:hypothetical protein
MSAYVSRCFREMLLYNPSMEGDSMEDTIVRDRPLSPYAKLILEGVQRCIHAGFYNAHAHIDRADTIDGKYLAMVNLDPIEAANLPLRAKQNLTGYLHQGPAYTEEDLFSRMRSVIERSIMCGTVSLDTCIDATPDIAENGLLAIRVTNDLKSEYSEKIKIRIAPNPIFGFKKGSGRWEVFREAANSSDFLSALPEKDDGEHDGRIGFRKHIRMVVELGCELKKEVHFHLDQANDPNECGTETLIEGLRWLDQPQIPNHEGPVVWVIHAISPSGYREERFKKLVDGLLEMNIGIIVCPTAAISMRQLRPIFSPNHSSIARMLDFLKRRVPVLLGSDNIGDVFVPQGDGDMLTEIIMAGHALRLAPPHVWAKIGAGMSLNDIDRAAIGSTLYQDTKSFKEICCDWQPAVD